MLVLGRSGRKNNMTTFSYLVGAILCIFAAGLLSAICNLPDVNIILLPLLILYVGGVLLTVISRGLNTLALGILFHKHGEDDNEYKE